MAATPRSARQALRQSTDSAEMATGLRGREYRRIRHRHRVAYRASPGASAAKKGSPRPVRRYDAKGLFLVVDIERRVVSAIGRQDFALAGMVRWADDAFLFHALDERGGLVITHGEPALNVADRNLPV